MKVFRITPEKCDWDMYRSATVVAENAKRALELIEQKELFDKEYQYPLTVKEIDITTEKVIATSFCNG